MRLRKAHKWKGAYTVRLELQPHDTKPCKWHLSTDDIGHLGVSKYGEAKSPQAAQRAARRAARKLDRMVGLSAPVTFGAPRIPSKDLRVSNHG